MVTSQAADESSTGDQEADDARGTSKVDDSGSNVVEDAKKWMKRYAHYAPEAFNQSCGFMSRVHETVSPTALLSDT